MSTPADSLNAITDRFVESEYLMITIKTPDRGVIEKLIRAAMRHEHSDEFGLDIIGLHFDSVPVRTKDVEALAETLETLRAVQIFTDSHSLQIS